MYRIQTWGGKLQYRDRRKGGAAVDLDIMDARIGNIFVAMNKPRLVRVFVPGGDNSDEIARLKVDLSELDVLADDYTERHGALVQRIRELARQDVENPHPDRWELQPNGKSYAEAWAEMNDSQRREMLKDNGVRVIYRGENNFTIEGLPEAYMDALSHLVREVV